MSDALEQLAEVRAAQRALALEVENSRSAQQRELEGLAASALELTEALQQLSDEAERRGASRDLAAARRRSSELHMELLLAQADTDGDCQDAKQVDEGLERRKLQALEDLKMAKEEVQVYEDCCQQLRAELRAAQVRGQTSSPHVRRDPPSESHPERLGTTNVLWCRKVPPSQGLQQSASAPSLR